jgi:hypothetical protein
VRLEAEAKAEAQVRSILALLVQKGLRLEAEAKAEAQVMERLLRCLLTYADVR